MAQLLLLFSIKSVITYTQKHTKRLGFLKKSLIAAIRLSHCGLAPYTDPGLNINDLKFSHNLYAYNFCVVWERLNDRVTALTFCEVVKKCIKGRGCFFIFIFVSVPIKKYNSKERMRLKSFIKRCRVLLVL